VTATYDRVLGRADLVLFSVSGRSRDSGFAESPTSENPELEWWILVAEIAATLVVGWSLGRGAGADSRRFAENPSEIPHTPERPLP